MDKYMFRREPKAKCALHDALTEDDFKGMHTYKALCRMSGLSELTISSTEEGLLGAEREMWEKNVKAFESAVKARVTRPKVQDSPAAEIPDDYPKPLYTGSFVFWSLANLGETQSSDAHGDLGGTVYESAVDPNLLVKLTESEGVQPDDHHGIDRDNASVSNEPRQLAVASTWKVKSILGKRTARDEPHEYDFRVKKARSSGNIEPGISSLKELKPTDKGAGNGTEVLDNAKTESTVAQMVKMAVRREVKAWNKRARNYDILDLTGLFMVFMVSFVVLFSFE